MSPGSPNPEAALAAAYRDEAARYARALQLAEALPADFRLGKEAEDSLRQIAALLAEVVEIDRSIAAVKRDWQQSGHRPGPELHAALAQTAALIERLVAAVGDGEREARARRDGLAPELDGAARGQQMQRAYGAAARRRA